MVKRKLNENELITLSDFFFKSSYRADPINEVKTDEALKKTARILDISLKELKTLPYRTISEILDNTLQNHIENKRLQK